MEIKEVTATYSRKVQLERYEPLEISESITGTLEEGDDVDECYSELYSTVRDSVERKLTHRLATKRIEDNKKEDE